MAEDSGGGGFWSNFAKWGARIGGYIAAPYTGGASIGIGESIAKGIGNHQAASKANEQLQAGNTQAMDVYKQSFAPYTNLGSQAANTLGGLMGFAPSSSMAPIASMAPQATEPRPTRTRPDDAPVTGQAFPRGTLASLGMAKPTDSSYSKIRMRAPDGEERDIDGWMAPQLEARGAVRI